MNEGDARQRHAVVAEGFGQEHSRQLRHLLKTFLEYLSLKVDEVRFDPASLIAGSSSAGSAEAKHFKDAFMKIRSIVNSPEDSFLFIYDSKSGFFERRRDVLSAHHNLSVSFVFIVSLPKPFPFETRGRDERVFPGAMDGIEKEEGGAAMKLLREKHRLSQGNRSFVERASRLLNDLARTLLMCRQVHLPLDICLSSQHSSLNLVELGYTLFNSKYTPVLPLIIRLLSRTTTRRRSVYFCTYQAGVPRGRIEARRDSVRTTKNELRFRRELKHFCESEKIIRIVLPGNESSRETVSLVGGIPKKEASFLLGGGKREVMESLLLVEGADRTLIISPSGVMRMLVSYVKRWEAGEERRQSAPLHAVIKITVKGTEVKEKRFFLAKVKT
jgi:hypothetical protein